MERDPALKKLASMVGRPHVADLKNAEFWILVEVMKVLFLVFQEGRQRKRSTFGHIYV